MEQSSAGDDERIALVGRLDPEGDVRLQLSVQSLFKVARRPGGRPSPTNGGIVDGEESMLKVGSSTSILSRATGES